MALMPEICCLTCVMWLAIPTKYVWGIEGLMQKKPLTHKNIKNYQFCSLCLASFEKSLIHGSIFVLKTSVLPHSMWKRSPFWDAFHPDKLGYIAPFFLRKQQQKKELSPKSQNGTSSVGGPSRRRALSRALEDMWRPFSFIVITRKQVSSACSSSVCPVPGAPLASLQSLSVCVTKSHYVPSFPWVCSWIWNPLALLPSPQTPLFSHQGYLY